MADETDRDPYQAAAELAANLKEIAEQLGDPTRSAEAMTAIRRAAQQVRNDIDQALARFEAELAAWTPSQSPVLMVMDVDVQGEYARDYLPSRDRRRKTPAVTRLQTGKIRVVLPGTLVSYLAMQPPDWLPPLLEDAVTVAKGPGSSHTLAVTRIDAARLLEHLEAIRPRFGNYQAINPVIEDLRGVLGLPARTKS